jgi:hypothetical protein
MNFSCRSARDAPLSCEQRNLYYHIEDGAVNIHTVLSAQIHPHSFTFRNYTKQENQKQPRLRSNEETGALSTPDPLTNPANSAMAALQQTKRMNSIPSPPLECNGFADEKSSRNFRGYIISGAFPQSNSGKFLGHGIVFQKKTKIRIAATFTKMQRQFKQDQ